MSLCKSRCISIVAVTLVCAVLVQKNYGFGGFSSVVTNLPEFQAKGSGFQFNKNSPPSLEATSYALFLSSLYGLRDKINTENISNFVTSLQNADNGYSDVKGEASSLQATFYALLISHHLGTPPVKSTSIGSYIRSLYDSESKLYANRPGEAGSIKSTALALQSFELLNELNRGIVIETAEEIRKTLQTKMKTGSSGENFFAFSEDENTVDNAYGIIVGTYVGFPFENVDAWAKFFIMRQILSGRNRGSFYVNKERTNTSIESTSLAITSLYYLQKNSKTKKDLVNSVNTEALLEYAKSVPYDLRAAAQAHAAVARTNSFQKLFTTVPSYEIFDNRVGIVDNRVIEGTQLKPMLSVKTLYGVAHAGLNIEATIIHINSNEQVNRPLKWNTDTSQYVTEDFYDTTNKLGPLNIIYSIRLVVVDLNQEIHFTVVDEKIVGYSIRVRPFASLAGKEIEPLEVVGAGTEFKFDVTLSTVTKEELTTGDFRLEFSILDSSGITIHFQAIDGRSNNGRLSFSYILSNADLPAGDITFRFEVSDSRSVHTTTEVHYILNIPMVATEIIFEGISGKPPIYKVGEKVKISILPASLRDLRSLVPYPSTDVHKKDIGDQRHFFLDVFSQGGTFLFSVRGHHISKSSGTSQYRFEFEIENTFDVIGTNIIVFRYMTANGQNITLQNYNSQQNEMYEETESLTYVVHTELELVSFVGAPKSGDLNYGDPISLRFKVRDAISGKQIVAKSDSEATVYLVLRHTDAKGRQSVSARLPAIQVEDKDGLTFVVDWVVSPNAAKGRSQLSLEAVGADATPLKLVNPKDGKEWQVNVNIGGEIEVKQKTYVSEDFGKVNFLIEFELLCRNRPLKGAQLRATIFYTESDGNMKELFTVPVARRETSGKYSVSWQLDSSNAPGGKYRVNVYREIDRARTIAEKKRGERMDESSLSLEPLASFIVEHSPQGLSLPMRTEFLVVVLFGAIYFTLSYRKMEYESKK